MRVLWLYGRWYIRRRGRLAYGGPAASDHAETKQIIALVMGVIGAALIVRGVWGGVWPLSVQFIAGVFLEVLAVLRWRYTI